MRYENYKKVDLPWLTEVPSHWDIKRIASVFEIRKEKNEPIKTDEILSLSAKYGVTPYSKKKEKGGNKPKSDLTKYNICREGDILVNCMNIVAGAVGISKYFGAVSPVYYPLITNSDNNKYFMEYIFRNYDFQRGMVGLGKGIMMNESDSGNLTTVRMRISWDTLKTVEIPIPPKEEQEQIARFLDWKINEIDRLIEQKKKKVELIETVYNETLNKNFNILNDGEVIKIKFKNFAKLQNGISESGDFFTDGNPFVSYSAVYNNLFLPTNIRDKAKSSKSQQEQFSVMEGDIFITRTSENVSDAFMVSLCEKTIEKSTFSGFLIRARIFKENIIPKFLLFYLMTDDIREELLKNLNLVTRVSISQDLIKNLSFAIPTLEYQKEIIRKCEKITKQKNILKNNISLQINNLKQLKQSIISDLVTGRLDVRSVDIPEY